MTYLTSDQILKIQKLAAGGFSINDELRMGIKPEDMKLRYTAADISKILGIPLADVLHVLTGM